MEIIKSNINFEELQVIEEAIEKSIVDITRQMKFLATKYEYHFNKNLADVLQSLSERLKAIITFYSSVLKTYEELRTDHNALKNQIGTFKTMFSSLIEKYDLASTLEGNESVLSPEFEENKENLVRF